MSDAQSYRRPPAREKAPGALALLDESFHRLRAAPPGVLGLYYAGSLPFALAMLYFWGDLSHSADALRYGTTAAFGLTLVFLWMKTFHALFARRLREVFNHRTSVRPTAREVVNLFIIQGVVHSIGLFAVFAAAVVTVPFGWVYAFFQSATAIGAGDEGSIREILRRSWRAALLWPKQNHQMLLVFSGLGLFVWINLLVAVFLIPQMFKLFTGEDNAFTRGGMNTFNSTTVSVTLSLAYLVLDPIVKTFYALRCFYVESQYSGEDLKSELRALPPVRTASAGSAPTAAAPTPAAGRRTPTPAVAVAAVLFAAVFAGSLPAAVNAALPPAASGAPAELPAPPAAKSGIATGPTVVQAPELNKSIEEVMRRREFSWRLPPTPSDEKSVANSWLESLRNWVSDEVKWTLKQIGRVYDTIRDWWHKMFPEKEEDASSPMSANPDFTGIGLLMRRLMYALIAVIACVLLYQAWKAIRRRRTPELAGRAAAAGSLAEPDLSDDAVVATQLPEDEWLQLSRRLLASGENRLALRALYLSVLAMLSSRELLAIARHKSNRDYQAELRRRARDRAELQLAFARNIGRFERVWYGPHPATAALFDQFMTDRQLISDAAGAPVTPPALV